MQEMTLLEVDKTYPDEELLAKLTELGMDGCTFNPFLSEYAPAMFYIHLSDITDGEKANFDDGEIYSALDVDGGGLVMTFLIGDIPFECPINMHYLQGMEVIPEMEDDLRIAVSLVAIERTTGQIKALRAFTLHPMASAELIVRAKAQLEHATLEQVDKANARLIESRIEHGVADGVTAWLAGV